MGANDQINSLGDFDVQGSIQAMEQSSSSSKVTGKPRLEDDYAFLLINTYS